MDDVVLGHSGPTQKEVVDKVVDMAVDFKDMSEANNFPFSEGKVVIVGSTIAIAREVGAKLASRGVKDLIAVSHTKDLGIDYTAAARRSVAVSDARLDRSRLRLAKVQGLAKVCPQASKLTTAGALPAGLYGASAFGMPVSKILRYRQEVARATGIAQVSACATTRLAIVHGRKGDPHFLYAQQLMGDFYSLWANNPGGTGSASGFGP